MKSFCLEKILNVVHWNHNLFSFFITKHKTFRFNNGQFILIGLNNNKYYKLIIRAYSIVTPNYANHIEFLSITIKNGKFTSLLKNIKIGDYILISTKSSGSLILDNIRIGKILYLLSTGTGLAPFISLIQDPLIYNRFDKIILIHGVSYIKNIAYKTFVNKNIFYRYIVNIKTKLIYYPTISREIYINKGRITELLIKGTLLKCLKLPFLNFHYDKLMLCGNRAMLQELIYYLTKLSFRFSIINNPNDFVFEYSFISN
ncbi:ferredoxin--NADP reductase [Candidatus Portiera aleyrodidarum]|uniref:ferredoxin--NADP(+) reductase n=1 Tax=Candidatus Portiera aleyrodidarum MED (Bemisia tabaci) TaxID=1163752 RepID=A0AAU8RRK6_9GAMM|nr:ferredoxin--NADP reductase [Candidatus Portiera aleyrodidarum]AFQ23996.1 flavodoxin reductase family protein [Candidatus Portiera aleyrodidarum BT-B-HRs]AFS18761.1 Ferredoxin--NADP reductase [Candidatus Portiera aleyrodidarum BT-QVLC]AFT80387.1 Ferredoxin--NADP [Candidatus Portiera aleyrodidarum BT-QVLC]AFT80667.1 Ferredoxin--NADP [Candidatus Portiera aleyrodidarum BT-B-HRs]AJF23975.1 ferredoxin-NADP reductase [Candidatus Portiera aleyrodidarum MED (Bemisia tabaci)]